MNVLFFGDIIGRTGRDAVKKILPKLKGLYAPDLTIANCENIAHGKGITEKTIEELLRAGIEIFTSGNHIWNQGQAVSLLQRKESPILRPANYPPDVPGRGYAVIEVGTRKVAVVNLVGRVFFQEDFDCPFRTVDQILAELKIKNLSVVLVDFHVEATSEAMAMGCYLDGRVSLVAGTHTHVQTADERILPRGTGYITDIGMVGAQDSIIGMDQKLVLHNFLTQMPAQFEVAQGDTLINAIHCTIDHETGKATAIKRIQEIIKAE